MEISKLKQMIPLYAANRLDPKEKAEVEKAISSSDELKGELKFWQKVSVALVLRDEHEKQGHPDSDELVGYVEGRYKGKRSAAELEIHFRQCDECRRELELIRRTYPVTDQVRRAPASILTFVPKYFKSLKLAYALPIAAILLIALIIWNPLAPSSNEVDSLTESAGGLLDESNYTAAEELYQRALSIAEQTMALDDSRLVAILDRLALTKRKQGELAEAESLYLRVLAFKEKDVEGDAREVGRILNQLSELRRQQGDNPGSRLYDDRATSLLANLPADSLVDLLRRQSSPLQKHAALTLIPQVLFRGPDTRIPRTELDSDITAIAMTIVIRRADMPSPPYKLSLITPNNETFQFSDELNLKASATGLDTLRITLDRSLFTTARGRYRIRLTEISPQQPPGPRKATYWFEVSG